MMQMKHSDLDGDGVGDNADAFPNDLNERQQILIVTEWETIQTSVPVVMI